MEVSNTAMAGIGNISANWLASILTMFMQFLPMIIIFSAVLLLPEFITWLINQSTKIQWSTDDTPNWQTFADRQIASKTVWQDERYKTNSKIVWY